MEKIVPSKKKSTLKPIFSREKTLFRLIHLYPATITLWLVLKGFPLASNLGSENFEGGYEFLQPYIDKWSEYRMFGYFFGVVLLIILGSFISFSRVLRFFSFLNPFKTKKSLVNTIPEIILFILFLTFSYALAGLCLDIIAFIFNFLT